MPAKLISEWTILRRGKPGHRFQERYDAARRTRSKRTVAGRVVRLVIAFVALAIGVVLVFIPGPAILFFFVAGSMLAAESRRVARALDWTEVQLRKLARWVKLHWDSLPLAGKIVVTIVLLAIGAAGAVIGYRIAFG